MHHNKGKRSVVWIAVLKGRHGVLLAAILALAISCGGRAPLIVGTYLDPQDGTYPVDRALRTILDLYREARPGVEVRTQVMRWDTMSQGLFEGDALAPDLQWIPQKDLGAAASSNALADLRGVVLPRRGDPDLLWQRDDTSLVLIQPDVFGLIYRADLFQMEKVTAPFVDWGALNAASAHLTVFDDVLDIDRYGLGVPFAPEHDDLPIAASLIAAGAGGVFDPAVADWARLAGTLARIDSWASTHAFLHPEAASHTAEDVYSLFNGGTFAMVYGSTSRMRRIRTEIVVADPENVQMMPLPAQERSRDTPAAVTGWYVGVNARGARRREALGLLRHLISPEADEIWVTLGEQVPLRRSTWERLEDHLAQPESRYLAVAAGMAPGWIIPRDRSGDGWRAALNRASQAVLTGAELPVEALTKAQAEFRSAGSQ